MKNKKDVKLSYIHQPLSLSKALTTLGSQVPDHSTSQHLESFTQGLSAAVEHPLEQI